MKMKRDPCSRYIAGGMLKNSAMDGHLIGDARSKHVQRPPHESFDALPTPPFDKFRLAVRDGMEMDGWDDIEGRVSVPVPVPVPELQRVSHQGKAS